MNTTEHEPRLEGDPRDPRFFLDALLEIAYDDFEEIERQLGSPDVLELFIESFRSYMRSMLPFAVMLALAIRDTRNQLRQ